MDAINSDRVAAKGGKSKNGEQRGTRQLFTPYTVEVTIQGTEPLLMHRYDVEAVKSKGDAKKGSAEKKTDNVESYLYRIPGSDEIGIEGRAFRGALAYAAKSMQDPRSPRKSAYELVRAGVRVRGYAKLGKVSPDYVDTRPVMVQRNRVARSRPAFEPGWRATFFVEVLAPEYIEQDFLHELVDHAGKYVGLLDGRPDFGLFNTAKFEVVVK